GESERERVAEGVEVRAAMVIDDALGIAGRSRGVEEADGLPLVAWLRRREGRIALGEKRLVVDRTEAGTVPVAQGIVDVDDGNRAGQEGERLRHRGGEL